MIQFVQLHREHVALISGAMTAVCVVPYLRDIARGTTKPQRASWLVWASLSVVASVSQLIEGEMSGAWLASGAAVGFTAVFIASIRRGEGGLARADVVAIVAASVGVALSLVVRQPMIALLAVVFAEFVATALTARKALLRPQTETLSTWMIDAVAGALAVAATTELSVAALIYPLNHTGLNTWVALSIRRGRRRVAIGAAASL